MLNFKTAKEVFEDYGISRSDLRELADKGVVECRIEKKTVEVVTKRYSVSDIEAYRRGGNYVGA